MSDPWAKGWANRLAGVFGDGPAVGATDDEENAKPPAPPTPAFPFSGVKATLAPPAARPSQAPRGMDPGMALKMGDTLVDGPADVSQPESSRKDGLVRISDVAKPPTPETMRNLATLAARDAGERYRRGESVEVTAATMPWLAREGAFGDAQKTNPDGSISVDAKDVDGSIVLKPGKSDARRIPGFNAQGNIQTPREMDQIIDMSPQEARSMAAKYHPELAAKPGTPRDDQELSLGFQDQGLIIERQQQEDEAKFNEKRPTQELSPLEKIGLQYNPMALPFVGGYELGQKLFGDGLIGADEWRRRASFYGDNSTAAPGAFDPNREMPVSFANMGRKIIELPEAIGQELGRAADANLVDIGEGLGLDKMKVRWDPLGFGVQSGDKGPIDALVEGAQAMPNEIMALLSMPFNAIQSAGDARHASRLVQDVEHFGAGLPEMVLRTAADPVQSFSEGPISSFLALGMTGLLKGAKEARAAQKRAIMEAHQAYIDFTTTYSKRFDDYARVYEKAKKAGDYRAPLLDHLAKQTHQSLVEGVRAYHAEIKRLSGSFTTPQGAAATLASVGAWVANPFFGLMDVMDLAKMRLYGRVGKAEKRFWTMPLEDRAHAELLNATRVANSATGAAEVQIRTAIDLMPKELAPTVMEYLRLEDKAGEIFDIGNPANNLVAFDAKAVNPHDPGLRGAWVLTEKGRAAPAEMAKKLEGQLHVANRWGGSLADLAVRTTERARGLGMFFDPESLMALYAPDVYRSPGGSQKALKDLHAKLADRVKDAPDGSFLSRYRETENLIKESRRTTDLGGVDGSEFRTNARRQAAKEWAKENPKKTAAENPYRAERYERKFGLRTDIDGWTQGIIRFVYDVNLREHVWDRIGTDPKLSISAEQVGKLPLEAQPSWALVPSDSIVGVAKDLDAWVTKTNERLARQRGAAEKVLEKASEDMRAGERVIRNVNKEPIGQEAIEFAPKMAEKLGVSLEEAIGRIQDEMPEAKARLTSAKTVAGEARAMVAEAEKARASALDAARARRAEISSDVAAADALVAETRQALSKAQGKGKEVVAKLEAEHAQAKKMAAEARKAAKRDSDLAEYRTMHRGAAKEASAAKDLAKDAATAVGAARTELSIAEEALRKAAYDDAMAKRGGRAEAVKGAADDAERAKAVVEQKAGEAVIKAYEKKPVSAEAAGLAEGMAKELNITVDAALEFLREEAAAAKGRVAESEAVAADVKGMRTDADALRSEAHAAVKGRRGELALDVAAADAIVAETLAALNKATRKGANAKRIQQLKAEHAAAVDLARSVREDGVLSGLRSAHKAAVGDAEAARGIRSEALDAEKAAKGELSIREEALRKAAYDDAMAKRGGRAEAVKGAAAEVDALKAQMKENRAKTAPKKYGKAAGRYIQEDIFVELANVERAAKDAARTITKFIRHWKSWKTAYSPTTTARNLLTNIFLFAPMAGISPFNPVNFPFYARAIADLMLPMGKRSEQWKRGYINGAYRGTHTRTELASGNELAPFRGGLQNVRDLIEVMPQSAIEMVMGGGNGIKHRGWRKFAESTVGNFGRVYGVLDDVFRSAYYNKFESRLGGTEAGLMARKKFIDYDAVSGFVQVLRQPFMPYSRGSSTVESGTAANLAANSVYLVVGQPFLAFTARAIPLFTEWLAENPAMAAAYESMYDHMSDAAAAALGLDADEERQKMRALPFYENARSVNMATVPELARDWATGLAGEPPMTETSVGLEQPIQTMNVSWASSEDYVAPQNPPFSGPLDQVLDFAKQKVMGSGFPLLQLGMEVVHNMSDYNQREVRQEGSGVDWTDQTAQILGYMWKKLAPPIAPSLTDITDRLGLTNQFALGEGRPVGGVNPEDAGPGDLVLRTGKPVGPQVQRMPAGDFVEKLTSAAEQRPDYRGNVRRMDLALLEALGIKAMERLPTETIANYTKSFLDRIGSMKANVIDGMQKTKAAIMADPGLTQDREEREARAAVPMVEELMRGVRPYMVATGDDGMPRKGAEAKNARATPNANDIWEYGQAYLDAMRQGDVEEGYAALDDLLKVIRRQLGMEANVPLQRAMDALDALGEP